MYRKIYSQLLDWKQNRKGKTALLIEGARRVGKSYIVEKFASREYDSYILIDFNHVKKDVMAIFENYITDLDMFFKMLSLHYDTKLVERKSIIVFDEQVHHYFARKVHS